MNQLPLVCYRGSVNRWECDENDHLNVRFYGARADTCYAFAAARVGLGPRRLALQRWRLQVRSQHIRFVAEAHTAYPLMARAGVVEVTADAVRVCVGLGHPDGQRVHAWFTAELALTDLNQQPVNWPVDVRRNWSALHIDGLPEGAAPRGLPARGLLERPPQVATGIAQMREISLARIEPADCDGAGLMRAAGAIAAVSDGMPAFMALYKGGLAGSATGAQTGGVAVEYRLRYWHMPAAHDLLRVASAVRTVDAKTYRLVHWLCDAESGQLQVSAEVVSLCMDLDTRRAIEVPPADRSALVALQADVDG